MQMAIVIAAKVEIAVASWADTFVWDFFYTGNLGEPLAKLTQQGAMRLTSKMVLSKLE